MAAGGILSVPDFRIQRLIRLKRGYIVEFAKVFYRVKQMTVRNYTNLNLDRTTIEATSRAFIENKNYSVHSIGPMPGTRAGLDLPLYFQTPVIT